MHIRLPKLTRRTVALVATRVRNAGSFVKGSRRVRVVKVASCLVVLLEAAAMSWPLEKLETAERLLIGRIRRVEPQQLRVSGIKQVKVTRFPTSPRSFPLSPNSTPLCTVFHKPVCM